MMGYEAHIAGLGDRPLGARWQERAIRWIKRRSAAEIAERRAAVVAAVREVAPLELVNGGGTGSLHTTAREAVVTEVTAGSGLYAPTLFDRYADFTPIPAAMFALPVVRRPSGGVATLLGGGYHASGPAGRDRLPEPYLPRGLRLDPREGAGEVQTPVHRRGGGVAADRRPRVPPPRQGGRAVRALRPAVPGEPWPDRGRGAHVPRRGPHRALGRTPKLPAGRRVSTGADALESAAAACRSSQRQSSATLGGARAPGARRQRGPGAWEASQCLLVIMTDDQTSRRCAMPKRGACSATRARRSRTASSPSRSAARRARPSSPGSTPTTTACSTTSRPRRLRTLGAPRPAGLAPARRLLHGPPRQVPQRLRAAPARRRAARAGREWHGPIDPSTYQLCGYTLNDNGHAVTYGRSGRNPSSTRPTSTAQGRGDHARARRRGQPVLPLGRLPRAPHLGRSADGSRRPPRPAPAPRHAAPSRRAAAAPPDLQRGRRGRQAGVHPPACRARRTRGRRAITGHLPRAARVAARGRRGGRRASSPRSQRPGELDDTLHHLHLRQRLLPRRAPHPVRQGAPLRAVDPRAADHPRARHPGAVPRQLVANVDLAPTILDATGASRGCARTASRCSGSPATQGEELGREMRSRVAGRRAREVRRRAHLPLHLR